MVDGTVNEYAVTVSVIVAAVDTKEGLHPDGAGPGRTGI